MTCDRLVDVHLYVGREMTVVDLIALCELLPGWQQCVLSIVLPALGGRRIVFDELASICTDWRI